MKLIDMVNNPWALPSEKLSEIVSIYCSHVRGEKIDLRAVEARLGEPLNNDPAPYEVRDGVAIISMEGVISKRANMFTRISGGVSTELIGQDLQTALDDPRVHAIILRIDSPGGSVDGTQTLADAVFNARDGGKPIVAWADGSITSGAYWIGSAAEQVLISGDTVISGSIGVAMQHVDVSKYEERIGIKTTDIYSGKYKRIASEKAPLTDEGRAHLQALSDQMYSVFVENVARNRDASVEEVLSNMAEARLFVGRSAIEAGLVDGVSTLDALVAHLKAGTLPAKPTTRASAAAGAPAANAEEPAGVPAPAIEAQAAPQPTQLPKGNEVTIDRNYLNANCAALVASILAEGKDLGLAEGRAAGASAELERIRSVEAQALPGHADLVNKLKFDGKTTGPEAAAQILAAERGKLGAKATDIAADAATLAGLAPAAGGAGAAADDKQATGSEGVTDETIKAAWDKDANLRGEFAGNFSAYAAFAKAEAAGKVKVLGKKSA